MLQLNEANNPPIYEPLNTDIRHESELELHEIPFVYENFPLNPGVGVKPESKYIKPSSRPPSEYVQRPIPPPPTTNPRFNIDADLDLAIYTPPTDIYLEDSDSPVMSPLADNFIASDSDGPPDHIYLEESPVMSPWADKFMPSDSDGPPDHIYLEESPVMSPLADIFIPLDGPPDHV